MTGGDAPPVIPAPSTQKPAAQPSSAALFISFLQGRVALPAAISALAAGAGFAWGGAGAAATEDDLAALSKETKDDTKALEARITNLEPLVKVAGDAYDMSALALEISVESHRYTADLIIDVGQLIDPNFKPDDEDVRLQKRLRQGRSVVDDIEISRP